MVNFPKRASAVPSGRATKNTERPARRLSFGPLSAGFCSTSNERSLAGTHFGKVAAKLISHEIPHTFSTERSRLLCVDRSRRTDCSFARVEQQSPCSFV